MMDPKKRIRAANIQSKISEMIFSDHLLDINEDRNNHYNATQGRFMYDTLNVVDLNHRILKDLNDVPANFKDKLNVELDLTHCDEIGPEGIAVSAVGRTQCISSPNVYKGDEFKL